MTVQDSSTGVTGIHVTSATSPYTKRIVATASGELHQLNTKITSTAAEMNLLDGVTYAPAQVGRTASPTYTGYRYKFVSCSATYRKASKHFLFNDLKTVVWGTAVTQMIGASLVAMIPGAPLSYSAYYSAAASTTAGATLRLFGIMANGAAATNAAHIRCKILALGKV